MELNKIIIFACGMIYTVILDLSGELSEDQLEINGLKIVIIIAINVKYGIVEKRFAIIKKRNMEENNEKKKLGFYFIFR